MSNVLIGGFSASLVFLNSFLKRQRPSFGWSYLILYFLLSPLMVSTVPAISAKLLPDIYWNSTNRIFRIDNTDHVFSVKIRDRVNIKCPTYDPKTVYDPKQVEYSEIYNVPRWGYDNCMLTPEAKIVGVCRTPFHESVITVVFREFTPLPGGLEFTPGRSYYFISTSNGSQNGLSNRRGGLCEQKNMKLKFEVQTLEEEFVDENDSGNSRNDESSSSTDTNSKWPNVKVVPSSVIDNANDKQDLPKQNSDSMLNWNSGEQISSPNISRPIFELLTTTTSVWYEIHTRDPDDLYAQHPKNKNHGIDKSDGRTNGNNNLDSVASNSRRMSGASKPIAVNVRHFLMVAIVSLIFSAELSSSGRQ